MANVTTGLENLIAEPRQQLNGKRIGLLCNPASVDANYQHARHLLQKAYPGQLAALFSPQHGFFAEKQDNMIESDDSFDDELKIPVFSLYGKTRIPTPRMFDHIDVLIIDLLDVGTRVYTFTSTLSYCLEMAATLNKQVIVLDRPNPVNGIQVEGNCLSLDVASFVGRYPIPMRHGLTMGEYAAYINRTFRIHCDLDVIPMKGWRRRMYYPDTGLPWVLPSPNLPTPLSAMVYPGQVIWEGTNISEGRGTTLPFEQFGAPFINIEKILTHINGPQIPGGLLRPVAFEPTSNKWAGKVCKGFQIHVTDPYRYEPYLTSLKLLSAIAYHHPDQFCWKTPPYEYENEMLPIDMIIGSESIRRKIEAFEDIDAMRSEWTKETDSFVLSSQKFYLYD